MNKLIADLHLHSKYSMATSTKLDLTNLEKYAKIKGLGLLGTGDFTHPKWLEELKKNLSEDGSGFLKTKTGFPFVLQAEVCNIYSQEGKLRKIHHVILAPSFEVVDQINDYLGKYGTLKSDGRPIFGGLRCPDMVESIKKISSEIEIIPAHIWTPWFSLFGSKSGFDRIEDCYKDQTKHIFALETGLSSDPAMNWRISALDKYTLISNSDAHSFWPWRIGRECNVFELKKTNYSNLINAIRTRDGLVSTLEFWPEEGKYHYDGHRNCNVCFSPKESIANRDICPKCGKTLTIGVMHRVEALADRPEGFVPKKEVAIPFRNVIALSELIAGVMSAGVSTKKVFEEYYKLTNAFGNELSVLLDASKEDLEKVTPQKIAEIIIKNRDQKIKVLPGYDGEYGHPIFENGHVVKKEKDTESDGIKKQMSIGDFD